MFKGFVFFVGSMTKLSISFYLQELIATPIKKEVKSSSPKEKMSHSGAKQHTSKKSVTSSMPRFGQSPPTRDSSLKHVQGSKQTPLSNEVHKLQIELERYIHKVKELANRGNN